MAVDNISNRPSPSSAYTPPSSHAVVSSATPASDDHDSTPDLEGDLSLDAHAVFATDYAQCTFANTTTYRSNEVTSSIDALRQVLESKGTGEKVQKTPAKPGGAPEPQLIDPQSAPKSLTLPPMELTMACLQKMKGSCPSLCRLGGGMNEIMSVFGTDTSLPWAKTGSDMMLYFWSLNLESVGHFMEYMLPVCTGQPTIAELLITHVGLYYLFHGCAAEESDPAVAEDLMRHGRMSEDNVEYVLSRLPFNLPSTYDYTFALTLAVSHIPLPHTRTMSKG